MTRIVRTEVYRFVLPFAAPVRIGREVLHDREGLLIALADDRGRCGYGEIAPLPGFDATTLERCLQDVPSLGDSLKDMPLAYDRFRISAPLLGIADGPASSWAAQTLFGVESALLGLYLQQEEPEGRAAWFPLPAEPIRIPVNGLFIPEPTADGLDRQLRELKRRGAGAVKVKIGRLPEEEEIRQIRRLAGEVGPGISLRLDGNRNLAAASYRRYYEALGDLPVEYVEEPLGDGEQGRAGEVPWPLAWDESLAGVLDREEPRLAGLNSAVRAVILKPGLLNGLHAMARAVRSGKKAGVRTIFSSAFNTGVTLALLGIFSRLAGVPPETVHGFDTLRYLAADVLSPSPAISGGTLEIPPALLFGGASLNKNRLREQVL